MIEMKFQETAQSFFARGGALKPFCPFPKACCREDYEGLPDELRRKLIAMGEECLHYTYPAIRATDFMKFQRKGNRVDYEDLYFNRRYALNSLTAAECVENRGRFLDDIINGVFALCEESGWQLPAHNSYERDAAQNLLPDPARPILDLFACETGAQLACIHYLLGEQLDHVSPQVTKRIRRELETRIITPYLTQHFWWMGRGDEPMCNWTPWCTQNILYTIFLCMNSHTLPDCLADKGEEISRAALLKAAESCDYFLKDYGEDGCCDEGAQYYRHAGLCLDGAVHVLNQVTEGAFEPLLHLDKIKNIAAYIYHVHVEDKYYFNFADCSPIAGRAGVREYLFGKHTGQPELMQFAAEDFRSAEAAGGNLFEDESHRLNLFYRMQTLFCYEEIKAFSADKPPVRKDIYYPSVGLFLTRNATFSLAVKAGDNDDSHNHNDTGSITLYKDGKPILADIGVESYTQKTFSPRRYEIWTMQSGYHNLPSIEGLDQHDGAAYRAKNVVTSLDDASGETAETAYVKSAGMIYAETASTENACAETIGIVSAEAADATPLEAQKPSFISMELAEAYPLAEAGYPDISYVRKVVFYKEENRITLTDRTNSQNVILNFITYEKPVLRKETSGLAFVIGNACLAFQGAKLLAVETLPITDKRLQTAWDHDLYRIRLRMTESVFEMRIL